MSGDMIIVEGIDMVRRDSFGRRLAMLRRDMELRQEDVIDRLAELGVTVGQTYLSTLENSDDRTPTGAVVAGLAKVLNTSADYLLMLSDDQAPHDARDIDGAGISPQAEELARIVDGLPPFRRDEILAHARMVVEMERQNDRDVKAAMDTFQAQLRSAGLVLGDDAMAVIRRGILDYTAALLGTNAAATVAALATSGDTGRSRSKTNG